MFHRTEPVRTSTVQFRVIRYAYGHVVMKPSTTHQHESAAQADSPTAAFLEALREEQIRFLDSVRAAGAHVRDERGHVALVAAIQTRLAQQLFDAQRAFLKRQAAIDAEVARIDAGADAPTTARVGRAPNGAFSAAVTLFPPPVALGSEPHRAVAPIDELGDVCDDAFEPVDIDPMLPQRELAHLLEQWWNRINADGQVMVDRARSRARLQAHAASIESVGRELRFADGQLEASRASNRHPSASGRPMAIAASEPHPAGTATDATSVDLGLDPSPLLSASSPFGPPIALALPMVLPKPSSTSVVAPVPTMAAASILAVPELWSPLVAGGAVPDLAELLDALARQFDPIPSVSPVAAGDDLTIKLDRWEDLDHLSVLDRLATLDSSSHQRWRRRSSATTLPRNLGAAVGPAAAGDSPRGLFDGVVVRTIVPMVAVTSVITLVMALVG